MMFAPLEGWRHVKVTDRSADGAQATHNPAAAAPPGDDCVDAGPDLDSRWANLAVTQDSTPRLRRQTAALWDLSRSMSAQVMNGPKATSVLSPFDSQLRTAGIVNDIVLFQSGVPSEESLDGQTSLLVGHAKAGGITPEMPM